MDSNVGSDQPTVEQLLQRIRDKAQSRTSDNQKRTFCGASSSQLRRSDFYSLEELREYAAAAYTHHNEVGKLNPRNPGWRNELVQFLKKVIQRMLDWYTRPLHLFQASTARALMEVSRALEDIQQKQLSINEQIAQLESELRSEIKKLKPTTEEMHSGDSETTGLSHSSDSHPEPGANEGH